MTAYVSRLLSRAGRPTGIRPRPRSRYEPGPGAYPDHGPIEFDQEWPQDTAATASIPPVRPNDPTADYPESPAVGPSVEPSVGPSAEPSVEPGTPDAPRLRPSIPTEDATPEVTPLRTDRQHPQHFPPEYSVDLDTVSPGSNIHSPDPGPPSTAAPSPAGAPPRPKPPDLADHLDEAPTAGDTSAPSPGSAHQEHPNSRHAMPDDVGPIRGATPRTRETPTAATPYAVPPSSSATGTERRRGVDPTTWPQYMPRAGHDSALRQRIVDALVEPVRPEPTEVVVHIDRIDVRAAPSSQPPPAAPRRTRAAPTSLESYLRAQSRRRPG